MTESNDCASKGVAEVIIDNQGHAETNSNKRHKNTLRKICYFMSAAFAMIICGLYWAGIYGACTSGEKPYKEVLEIFVKMDEGGSRPGFDGKEIVRLRKLVKKHKARVVALETENAVINKTYEWLWASHNINCAVFEDDPAFMEKNSGRPWRTFKEKATPERMEGFLLIIHDGFHPNMEDWHDGEKADSLVRHLKKIDWSQPPSMKALELHSHLNQEAKDRLDRMFNIMRDDPEGWVSFIQAKAETPWAFLHPAKAEEAVTVAMQEESKERLWWITSQSNWYSILSQETVNQINNTLLVAEWSKTN